MARVWGSKMVLEGGEFRGKDQSVEQNGDQVPTLRLTLPLSFLFKITFI